MRAELSDGKRNLKSTACKLLADDCSSLDPLINFTSSTLEAGARSRKNSALADFETNLGSLKVRIRVSSSEVAGMLRVSKVLPGLRRSRRARASVSSSDSVPRIRDAER